MKLTTRILILAGAALLPGVIAGAYNELALRAQRSEEVNQLAMRNTRQAAAFVEQVMQSIKGVLTTVAVAGIPSEQTACNAFMASLRGSLDYLGGVGLIDADGKLRCASRASPPVDLNDRTYFQEAQRTGEFVVGEFVEGRVTQRPQLITALPLPGQAARPAVLFAGLELDWLQKRIENLDVPSGANITIADRKGVIIARSPQSERFIGTSIPQAFMHLVNAPAPGTLELKSQDGTVRILAYSPVAVEPKGLYVSSGLSKENAFLAINRSSAFAALVIGAGALLAMTLALLLGRLFIERPVGRILLSIDSWRAGNVSARTGANAKQGEIGAIGWSLDRLLDELESRNQQRDLLSKEMAHRVKNTLAIVQAIASQTLRIGAAGFSSFSARLGALGSAYNVLLAGEWQASTVASVVAEATAPHQTAGSNRIAFEGEDAIIEARLVIALTLIIHELCTNAVKYGALSTDEGRIRIVSRQLGSRVELTWIEIGGPPVAAGKHAPGFGTTLIRNAFPLEYEAEVKMDYPPEGARCIISFLSSSLARAA